MNDYVVLASTYRGMAVVFRKSADTLYLSFAEKQESTTGNLRAIPFYYLISHAAELFLKCALLKRGVSSGELRKFPIRHSLTHLLNELKGRGVPVTDASCQLIDVLSEQHSRHELRYTALLDDGTATYMPHPEVLFALLDELLMLGRISTHGV